MAFALTDEHDRQRSAWKGLPAHNRTAGAIRAALIESEVDSRDPVARFVGLKAYEKAGGGVRRDLFSEEGDVYLQDCALLNQLAVTKLEKHARKLKKQGLAWVEVCLQLDYANRAAYTRVKVTQREPTEAERTQIEELEAELEQIRSVDELEEAELDGDSVTGAREREIEQALNTLQAALEVVDPEQQAKAGALVHIDFAGKLCVETGLLKPEDARLFARETESAAKNAVPIGVHSVALLQRFTAVRTQALMAEFAQNPQVALADVVHRLVVNTFSEGYRTDSPLTISSPATRLEQFNKELETTEAHRWLEDQRAHLLSMLPTDPKDWFQWIAAQPLPVQLALLAFCASQTLDAVQHTEAHSHADDLAKTLGVDLRKWWKPTAAGYLGSLKKNAVLSAVTEAVSADQAARIEKLKRGPLAVEAERLLEGTGWLPAFVRDSWAGNPPMRDISSNA